MENIDYILKKTTDDKYLYLSISTSMSRLDDYIHSIEIELLSKNVAEGLVLFDLLVNNSTHDRFYQCFFNGRQFEISKFKKIECNEIDKKIIKISSCFYIKNMDVFDSLFFTIDFKSKLQKYLFNLSR